MSWLLWVALLLPLGALAVLAGRRGHTMASERATRDAADATRASRGVLADLSRLEEASAYLTARNEARLHAILVAARPHRLAAATADGEARRGVREALGELERARQAVAAYNGTHVARELARHADLLVKDEGLSEEQAKAVVRDDERNLVVAAAGSGKTRVLRARIRYLLARRNPTPASRIAAMTYTRDAAQEIQGRLAKVGVHVKAGTLHALGFEIVAERRGQKPAVAGEDVLRDLVRKMIQSADDGSDPAFAELVRDALAVFHRGDVEPLEDPGEPRRTLAGETVKSLGERRIADFLLRNGVAYAYEAPARWAPRDATRREYQPDFTLPEHGVTIEHWGLRKDGTVPPWFTQTTEEYKAKMRWARETHAAAKRTLVETYDHERDQDFEALLARRLRAAGVELRPLSLAELKRRVQSLSDVEETFSKTLADFVANARTLRLHAPEIAGRAAHLSPRVQAFARCGAEALRRYEAFLASSGRVDFTDMVHEAAEILERGEGSDAHRYDQILVDEFQDLSPDRARLVQALLKFGGGRLFAVGDDWQAIYAFSGGSVGYVVDFASHFGPFTLSTLSTNYRSPQAIVEAGTVLIEQNPRQIAKDVRASRPTTEPPLVHTVEDDAGAVWARVAAIAKTELARRDREGETHAPYLMIISRTRKRAHEGIWQALRKAGLPVDDGARIEVTSAHSAKGKEAPVVVIADATEDLFGFPCQVEGTDLLLPVRLDAENAEEEERRLFYVALTRATRRLHIVAREGRPSRFLREIQGEAVDPPRRPSQLEDGQRADLVGTVVQLLEPTASQRESGMTQLGLFQTGRDRILYKSWRSANAPRLELGRGYQITGARIEVYNGRPSAVLDAQTRVAESASMSGKAGEADGVAPLKIRPRRQAFSKR